MARNPEEPFPERPMNVLEATLWSIVSLLFFASLAQAAKKFVPGLADDAGLISLCQIVAYVTLLWILKTLYFDGTRLAAVFATGRGSWVFYPIAILLGLAIQIPANGLYELILARWPDKTPATELLQGFGTLPLWRKVTAGVGLVLTTPLIEEALFRGALFGTLRRRHGPVLVVAITAAIFGFVHVQPQMMAPIAIVGAVLAFLRVASGSLWPGVVMHMTFNAFSFYAMTQGDGEPGAPSERMPIQYTVTGTVATAVLLVVTDVLRKRMKRPEPELPEVQS